MNGLSALPGLICMFWVKNSTDPQFVVVPQAAGHVNLNVKYLSTEEKSVEPPML